MKHEHWQPPRMDQADEHRIKTEKLRVQSLLRSGQISSETAQSRLREVGAYESEIRDAIRKA